MREISTHIYAVSRPRCPALIVTAALKKSARKVAREWQAETECAGRWSASHKRARYSVLIQLPRADHNIASRDLPPATTIVTTSPYLSHRRLRSPRIIVARVAWFLTPTSTKKHHVCRPSLPAKAPQNRAI